MPTSHLASGFDMDSYQVLKSLHVIGAILFVGNIVITGWWKAMADRTLDPRIIAFAQRQVTLTDWIFTVGGAAILGGAGYGNALLHQISLDTPWLAMGQALFGISGLIWLVALVPLQVVLGKMAAQFAQDGNIPDRYWSLERLWQVAGTLATLVAIAAVPVMAFRPG